MKILNKLQKVSAVNQKELLEINDFCYDKNISFKYHGTIPQRFLRTILTLCIRKVTLRCNNRSTKICKSDLFVELYIKLRTIQSVRKC